MSALPPESDQIAASHQVTLPIGSFKVRGGIVYFDRLKHRRPKVRGIVTPTARPPQQAGHA
jgi:threonine dehydratase